MKRNKSRAEKFTPPDSKMTIGGGGMTISDLWSSFERSHCRQIRDPGQMAEASETRLSLREFLQSLVAAGRKIRPAVV